MFEQRAVAFLDILGFRPLVAEAEGSPAGFLRLLSLKNVIEAHVRFDNANVDANVPDEMHPKYLFISDSVILSAPLKVGKYDGLDVIVVKTVQIAQKVLELGYLIRGGITIGPVWHEEKNIFGSGYIRAYLTQEELANHPRVLLSEEAAAAWRQPNRAVPELCLVDGNSLIVDILHAAYYRTNSAGITMEQYVQPLRVYIETNLRELPLGSEPRTKWEWMAGFYNLALKRHTLGLPPFTNLSIP